MEVKIDKRTNAYKNSIKNPEIAVEEGSIEYERNKRIDNVIIEAAAKGLPVKIDLLHCPGCGVELLDDERNSKSAAYCRACIWRKA